MQLLVLRHGYTLKLKENQRPDIWERALDETRVMIGAQTSLSCSES